MAVCYNSSLSRIRQTSRQGILFFESVVLNFQEQLKERRHEQVEETTVILRNQCTAFTKAYKLLSQYIAESIVMTEVLRNWYTYYGQVFEKLQKTCELISSLLNC